MPERKDALPLDRRSLLTALGAGLAFQAVGPAAAEGLPGVERLAAALPENSADRDAMARVGAAYLTEHATERAALERSVRRTLGRDAPADDPSALRARMAEAVRRDFAAGRTVRVQGWCLASSEAHACALLSLDLAPPFSA